MSGRAAALTVVLAATACSSDASTTNAVDAASTGKGTGGAGNGGKDAASSTGGQATACGVDAGSDGCRQCLASNCCADFVACSNDATCSAAFDAYQTCVKNATSTSEQGACIGGFSRALKDAGASATLGSAVGSCVFRSCTVCGASAI